MKNSANCFSQFVHCFQDAGDADWDTAIEGYLLIPGGRSTYQITGTIFADVHDGTVHNVVYGKN